MGFGSYDESEQERQQQNGDDEDVEGVDTDGGDEGELSFESSAPTSELVGKLDEMRDEEAEDESENADD